MIYSQDTLRTLELRFSDMNFFQAVSREKNGADEAAMFGLSNTVDYSSVFLLVLIITTGSLQVYFVRKLFAGHDNGSVTPAKI